MFLRGPAGAGKSAIAQKIGEDTRADGLLATFFFSRVGPAERSNGDFLIPTLVIQLLEWMPELKPLVVKAIDDDPLLFESSIQTTFYRTPPRPQKAAGPKTNYQGSYHAPKIIKPTFNP